MRPSNDSQVSSRTDRHDPLRGFPGGMDIVLRRAAVRKSLLRQKRLPEYFSVCFPLKTEPHAVC